MDLSTYYDDFISYFEKQSFEKEPVNLYTPISYILTLGGKRIRPILTLIASEVFSGDYKKALPAALAVEMFHNFTLVHDDIMDDAPLRRAKQTVHEKWDVNTGILSGDAMLILAYQYFENYEPKIFQRLAKLFSKTALEVCDGQQMDVDFETRNNVSIDEYIEMIRLKTSVLVGASLKMGAIVAEANEEQSRLIYDFGLNLGIAFQIQDDYLDTFGDPETFGKQVGGDIIENKKTYLYLKTLDISDAETRKELEGFYKNKLEDNSEKIKRVRSIFEENNIPKYTKELIQKYTQKAFNCLEGMEISSSSKQLLIDFGTSLMDRTV